jgi:hypothetical protein
MWQRQKWLKVGALVFALAAIIAGVRFIAAPAFVSAPDHVHVVVTRIQPPSGDHTTIFDQQFDGVAHQVYAQLVSGASIPANAPVSCPNIPIAPYYHYDLTFSRMGTQTGFASSDAHGCQIIQLDPLGGPLGGGREYFSWHAPDGTSFWETLNQLLNAPLPI